MATLLKFKGIVFVVGLLSNGPTIHSRQLNRDNDVSFQSERCSTYMTFNTDRVDIIPDNYTSARCPY